MICTEFINKLNEFRLSLKLQKDSFKQIKTNKKIIYYNVACGFDIETSSFYQDFIKKPENKRAIMYAWKFAIEDITIIGRTWEQLIELTNIIT